MLNEIKEIMSRPFVLVGMSSTISLVVGAGAGYYFTKKRIMVEMQDILGKEIMEARRFYSALNKRDEFSSPNLLMRQTGVDEHFDQAVKALAEYSGSDPDEETEEKDVPDESPVVNENVFDWFDKDKPKRPTLYNVLSKREASTIPHVITDDEFMQSELESSTYTFYEADGVLSDEHDNPVEDVEGTVGSVNLDKFGEGSNDSNIVYIQNSRIGMNFEVLRHKGSYASVVHGIDDEIRHSATRKRRFRGDDE